MGLPNWIFLSNHNLHLRSWITTHYLSYPLFLLPSGCCKAEEASVAMDPAKILKNLPMELVLIVLEQTVRVPKVHFFKLFRHYNGGLLGRPLLLPGEFDPGETGVEDVSPFSGARKLAKLTMEISAGKSSFPSDARGNCPSSCACSYPLSLNDPKLDRDHDELTSN